MLFNLEEVSNWHSTHFFVLYTGRCEVANTETKLDTLDHVAIVVEDLNKTVDWYTKKFNCEVTYQDDTWAMIKFANMSLAFVVENEHPPHISILRTDASEFGELVTHRDGSRSCYIEDPSENTVEISHTS